jgi:hypothetical protein
MTDNPNLTAALTLASRGLRVFPCNPDKRPRPGIAWKERATTDERQIMAWWRRWPDSLPGVPMGHGLLTIDCDRHGGPDGVAAFAALGAVADPCTVRTPSGGVHFLFVNPDDLGNGRGLLPEGVDVRGKGGYIIGEGAELPDGRRYEPGEDGGLVDALDNGRVPRLPVWLLERLRPMFPEAPPQPALPVPAPAPSPEISTREEAAFAAALDAECRNVREARQGGRNETLNKAAFNVATAVAAGWGTRATAEAALTAAALACGLQQPEIRDTISSGFRGGLQKPRQALADRRPAMDAAPLGVINGLGPVEVEDDVEADEGEAPPISEDLTRVGGLLGTLVDFIVDTSRRPNRRIALAAALPLMAALCARKWATPTGGGLQLYVIATYPTAGGKQHQIDAIDAILRAAKLPALIGPSAFMSMSAVIAFAKRQPLALSSMDEFGAMLSRLGNPRASSHEQGISAILRSLWGAGFSVVKTPERAGSASEEIKCPALSIFGPTTATELYEALKGRDITGGFLNRFLVIDGGNRVEEVEPRLRLREAAADLAPAVREIYGCYPPGIAGYDHGTPGDHPLGHRVPWEAAAREAFMDFSRSLHRRMDANAMVEPFLGRTAEIGLRCATLLALGEAGGRACVTRAHIEWGLALALQSTERLISDAGRYMTDPLGAAEFERKILEKLRAAPGRRLTMRALHRAMQWHIRAARDLHNALDALARAQRVVVAPESTRGGARMIVALTA